MSTLTVQVCEFTLVSFFLYDFKQINMLFVIHMTLSLSLSLSLALPPSLSLSPPSPPPLSPPLFVTAEVGYITNYSATNLCYIMCKINFKAVM